MSTTFDERSSSALLSSTKPATTFRFRSIRLNRIKQRVAGTFLFLSTSLSLLTTVAIVVMLIAGSSSFFASPEINMRTFLTDTKWTIGQTQGEVSYGVIPLMTGTLRITAIGMLISLPLGLLTAVFLSEYATKRTRDILKPALELLAGVPTVVLGFFAIAFITPGLQGGLSESFKTFNAMSAGIAVGILCLPLVTSLAEDTLRSVPMSLRESAYGLGSTKLETIVKVVLPAALSGIISAFLLAISRAVGETMVVALAAGSTPTFSLDPRISSQTMTGFIVNTFQSDTVTPGSISYQSVYAVAFVLFVFTMALTLLGNWIRSRFREVYH